MPLFNSLLWMTHVTKVDGLFGEPFSSTHLISFTCIWVGPAIYSADALRQFGAKKSLVLDIPS